MLFDDENVNISNCKTVCLTLGPYRNLTTLTASVLFLHPNCQVLNHAGDRIFENNEVNFLSIYTRNTFDNFIEFATKISLGGKRGDYGGSITLSHAFDSNHTMDDIFSKTGLNLSKSRVECLFWKESLRTSNYIRENAINLRSIIEKEERLRFLMPIRNPLDCAKSNLKTGKAYRFIDISRPTTIREVLKSILNEIEWFAINQVLFPDRFFCFFEHSISNDMLQNLADFLILDKDEEWLTNAELAMVSKSNYEHDTTLLEFYKKTVEQQFSKLPEFKNKLLQFLSS